MPNITADPRLMMMAIAALAAVFVLLTGLARNTLKGHLRALVNDGQLVLYGAGRGSRYRVP